MVYFFIAIIFFALILVVIEMKEIIDRQKILEMRVGGRITDFTMQTRKILEHCEDTLKISDETVECCVLVEKHLIEFMEDLEKIYEDKEDNNE